MVLLVPPPATELAPGDLAAALDTYAAVLDAIGAGAPLTQVLDAIVTGIEGVIKDGQGSILILDAPSQVVYHGAAPSLPEAYTSTIDGMRIGPAAGSCGTAAYTGLPVHVADIAEDPLWTGYRDYALPFGLRACWSTPVLLGGQVVATLAVYREHPGLPTLREEGLIAWFTRLTAGVFGHDRRLGAVRANEELFRRTFADNAAALAIADLSGQLVQVNRAMCQLTGCGESRLLESDAGELFGDEVAYAVQQSETQRLQTVVMTPSGALQDVLVLVSPVTDETEAVVAMCLAVNHRS